MLDAIGTLGLFVSGLVLAKRGTGHLVKKKRKRKAVKEFVDGGGPGMIQVRVPKTYVLTRKEDRQLRSGKLSPKGMQAILDYAEERHNQSPDAAEEAEVAA